MRILFSGGATATTFQHSSSKRAAMGNVSISFEYPWLLLLGLAIPLLWLTSFRALAMLGHGRRLAALLFRSIVLLLLILAMAGIQWVWISEKMTVVYLLDQSDSIARGKRDIMLNYAIESVQQHRQDLRGDRSGLIVFGREAAIEFPPYDDDLPVVRGVESYLGRTDATNLEAALKLAQAAFPEDAAKRVVILTDGVETLGSAAPVAQAMAEAGIGIDVVPISLAAKSEILVEKIDLPANIRQGQPFETRIVIHRYQEDGERPVVGRLQLKRKVGHREQILLDQRVELDQSVNVFPIRDTIDQPAGYTYRAEFIPDDSDDDALQQNNRADAVTYIRGKGRVLLIEDWNAPGEFGALVEALRRSDIEVDVQSSDQLFTSLAELQAYDCVILAGVPRSSGDTAQAIANFSDEQIEMLVRNTEYIGSGLIMLGGPNALGAGGWANTAMEKAMPVDFQIKNKKIEAVGALAMILHASEIAQGNYWQKRIGQAALEVLGPMDYCGVLQYGSLGDSWLWGGNQGMLRVGPNRAAMVSRMRRMTPGDMPDFQPAMQLALRSLVATPASIKHMIIISDGDPTPPAGGILTQFSSNQIKISTVAVGAHGPAGHQTLQKIATTTGGNYYVATNPAALPKIFQREAMRVSRPLVYEPDGGLLPQLSYPHEIVQGLPRELPNLAGFVLTSLKDSPLVQVPIRSSNPTEPENQTVLATWEYGAGRTAVFASDVGQRWAGEWTAWSGYDQFFSQLVRWAMRPTTSEAKFTVATHVVDGRVDVVVNALDQDDEFLNFLDLQAIAVGPDLQPLPLVMRQAAPGRYVGAFEADGAGSYLVNVLPGPGMAPLTTGASVPFSDEYRVRRTNLPMLEQLAGLEPPGGVAGHLSQSLDAQSLQELLQHNTYRGGLPRAMSMQDIWPWCLVLGAVCLWGDIFVRRVAVDYAFPLKWLLQRLRPGLSAHDAARSQRLQSLKSKKNQISGELQQAKAATRFEALQPAEGDSLEDAGAGQSASARESRPTSPPKMAQQAEQDGYTARLLAAKKAAQRKSNEQR
ncbi:MAG: VWA domain-containing protein [Planctomycetales bacterium]|nr:VWA domain-containing protein [Planctomycetales bacterium]